MKKRADEIKAEEARLEESIKRFDTILEENDNKAQEAERQFEKESKNKHEKVQDIKLLEQQIKATRSDIMKQTESLEECSKYKDFLDSLTPSSWFSDFSEKKRERQRARRRARIEKRKKEFLREQEALILDVIAKAEKKRRSLRKGRRQRKTADDDIEIQLPEISVPHFDDESFESSGDECPMWFNKPEQLVEKFSILENEILFLLKQVHEQESKLHSLKLQFNSLKLEEDKEDSMFVTELRHQICLETERCANVKESVNIVSFSDEDNSTNLLSLLQIKAIELYEKCGLSDNSCNPSLQFILSEIEATAESILSKISKIPSNYLKKAIKKKKSNRRMEKRAQQHAENERNAEERRKQVSRYFVTKQFIIQIPQSKNVFLDNTKGHAKSYDTSEEESWEAQYVYLQSVVS